MFSAVFLLATVLLTSHASSAGAPTCKCFPGDACWPSPADWNAFNRTLGGKLIKTVPAARVCHNTFDGKPSYNGAQCDAVTNEWQYTESFIETSYGLNAPFFSNMSCDPFTGRQHSCIVGTYVPYAVKALTSDDVVLAMKFAKSRNIRFVVRNTGHDYSGRSSGSGSLAIWMHHMRGAKIVDFKSSYYNGKAMEIQAGMLGQDVAKIAHDAGYVVVSGDCPTVGVVGGYTQGGGYSPLTSRFGLAPDQVLSYQVLSAAGKVVTASPKNNSDLYWALSGGGPGNYGIVLSMTSRLYPDAPTSTATLNFSPEAGKDLDDYWRVIQTFLGRITSINDLGAHALALYSDQFFSLRHTLGHGVTPQQLNQQLRPVLEMLNQTGIKYSYTSTQYPTYLTAFNATDPALTGTGQFQSGGWLIPRTTLNQNTSDLIANFRTWTSDGALVAVYGANASVKHAYAFAENAVLPAWRTAGINAQSLTIYNNTDEAVDAEFRRKITDQFMPGLKKLAPESGAYQNEGDPFEPEWKTAFYGRNYGRLLQIKKKWDPEGLFWVRNGVGSEGWRESFTNGRFCKVAECHYTC